MLGAYPTCIDTQVRLPNGVEEDSHTHIHALNFLISLQTSMRPSNTSEFAFFEPFGIRSNSFKHVPGAHFFTLPPKALPLNNNIKLSPPSRRPWIAHSQIPSEAMACYPMTSLSPLVAFLDFKWMVPHGENFHLTASRPLDVKLRFI